MKKVNEFKLVQVFAPTFKGMFYEMSTVTNSMYMEHRKEQIGIFHLSYFCYCSYGDDYEES
jgi:hypothetical protein